MQKNQTPSIITTTTTTTTNTQHTDNTLTNTPPPPPTHLYTVYAPPTPWPGRLFTAGQVPLGGQLRWPHCTFKGL
ncbi:hypothetical protein E2C01_019673 [Portunus trituberculatus]|uniref:Uncharacterized protein n=1 Tax=Portunus trituberculatus TaxID=210409 RepID=A0A5B7DY95_PORTR|nr:hypothetical protein [Portunus trituberculatus]